VACGLATLILKIEESKHSSAQTSNPACLMFFTVRLLMVGPNASATHRIDEIHGFAPNLVLTPHVF
jgi:hypothetical protein